MPFFAEFGFEHFPGHVIAPVAVPVRTPGVFGGFEEDAGAVEVGVVVMRGEDPMDGGVEFWQFAVVFEGALVQVVFCDGLEALRLWPGDFARYFSGFVGDVAQVCEQGCGYDVLENGVAEGMVVGDVFFCELEGHDSTCLLVWCFTISSAGWAFARRLLRPVFARALRGGLL